jgi:hypothetical protein
MRKNNFALNFFVAILTLSLPAIALAQQAKVIELVKNDGGVKTVTITMDDEHILFEVANTSDVLLLTTEAAFTIDHADKSYHEVSYDEILALLSRSLNENAGGGEVKPKAAVDPDVEIKITEETDSASGFKGYKFIRTNKGKPEIEMWLSTDLMPVKLRAINEKVRKTLPADYWKKRPASGLHELIILYGIPVKIITNGKEIYHMQAGKSPSSSPSFQVPSDYKKLKH